MTATTLFSTDLYDFVTANLTGNGPAIRFLLVKFYIFKRELSNLDKHV